MIRVFLSLLLASILFACTSKISPQFTYNRYIPDVMPHVVNDSIPFYHNTFGDVDFIREKKILQKQLKGKKLNHVLLYGKTDMNPFYEYYLLFNPDTTKLDLAGFNRIHDTLVHGNRYIFVGKGVNDRFPESDFQTIYQSLLADKYYRRDLLTLSEILGNSRHSNQYLKAFEALSSYPAEGRSEKGIKLQYQLTYLSFLGKNSLYDSYLKNWEGEFRPNADMLQKLQKAGLKGKDRVINEIIELSKNQRLLMFNENHFFPQHRMLLTELLPHLKAEGFTHLALEALEEDSLLNLGELLSLQSGFYTREQYFMQLIHTAQALGFQLVMYENRDPDYPREAGQAENLYRKTFAQDSHARVVLLGGISHISEKTDRRNNVWMAQLFKEKYGINPLTFSQTHLLRYRKTISEKLLLIAADSLDGKGYQVVDYQLINHLDWGFGKGSFTYKNKLNTRIQLAIFRNESGKKKFAFLNQVPEYSMLLEPGEKYVLPLVPGKHMLLVFDGQGKLLEDRDLEIL